VQAICEGQEELQAQTHTSFQTVRLAARKDEGQADLVADLRKLRFQVKVLNDTPDLIVRIPFSGHIILLEVDGVTKNRKRSGAQLDFLH
jgi:hypothetical protein